jgi:hypothetical protein
MHSSFCSSSINFAAGHDCLSASRIVRAGEAECLVVEMVVDVCDGLNRRKTPTQNKTMKLQDETSVYTALANVMPPPLKQGRKIASVKKENTPAPKMHGLHFSSRNRFIGSSIC